MSEKISQLFVVARDHEIFTHLIDIVRRGKYAIDFPDNLSLEHSHGDRTAILSCNSEEGAWIKQILEVNPNIVAVSLLA